MNCAFIPTVSQAAHVFWTMWTLMQAVNSTIDFDFAE